MTNILLQRPKFLPADSRRNERDNRSLPIRDWNTDVLKNQLGDITLPEGQLYTGAIPTVAGGELLFDGLLLVETLLRPGEPQNLGILHRFLGSLIDLRGLPLLDLNGKVYDRIAISTRIDQLGGKPIDYDLTEALVTI